MIGCLAAGGALAGVAAGVLLLVVAFSISPLWAGALVGGFGVVAWRFALRWLRP